jgi:hypothetical protein
MPQAFNIDRFLEEFNEHDCNRGFDEDTGEEIVDEECRNKVQNQLFDFISNENLLNYQVFNYFDENLYRPLALHIPRSENLF